MHLFAGIDPGTTYGLCLFNLRGSLILLYSAKNSGKEAIIRKMLSKGKGIAIASDKKPVPETVRKIGAMMNVRVFFPEKSMLQNYKTKITSKYPLKNLHQRDACAACLWLYRKFENKFRQIDTHDVTQDKNNLVKEMVVRGYTVTDILALNRVMKEKKTKKGKHRTEEYIKYLESKLKSLVNSNLFLRSDIKLLEKKFMDKDSEILRITRKIRGDTYKNHEVKVLNSEIRRLKAMLRTKNRKKQVLSENKKLTKSKKDDKSDLKTLLSKLIDEYRTGKT